MSASNFLFAPLTLEQIIDRKLCIVSPDTPIKEAIASMSQVQASCVLVVEEQRLVGLFTERDVVRVAASQMPLERVALNQVMTAELVTLPLVPMPDIDSVVSLLRQHQIRHLPIVNDLGQPVGMITPHSLGQALDSLEMYKALQVLQQQLEEETAQLRQVNAKLQQEVTQRRQVEEALQQTQDYLTEQVEQQTVQLARANTQLHQEIQERQTVEDELRENEKAWQLSQERLESILSSLEDVVWSFNPQISKLLYLNAAIENLYGRSVSEFFQNLNLWWEVAHPEDRARVEMANLALLETGSKDLDYRILRPDGEVRWIRDRACVIYNAEGIPIRIDSLVTDITESKQAEKELLQLLRREQAACTQAQEAQKRISNILESISDAFVSLDREWRYTYVNQRAGQLFHRRPEELIGKNIWEEFPEGVGQTFDRAYYTAVREQTFIQLEEYDPPGNRWFENRIYPTQDGVSIFFQEITDRKLAEAALQYQLELDRLVASISTRFINLASEEIADEIELALREIGEFTQVDSSYVFLISDDRTTFNMRYEWVAPGQHPQIQNLQNVPNAAFPWGFAKIQQGEIVYVPNVDNLPAEAAIDRENWQALNLRSVISVPLSYQGTVLGWVGFVSYHQEKIWSDSNINLLKIFSEILTNALQRKHSEEVKQQSEELFRQLAETIHEVFFIYSIDYSQLLYISPAYEKIWGRCCESAYQEPKSWLEGVHPEDCDRVNEAFRQQYEGKEFHDEYRIIRPDGSQRWIFAHTFILFNQAGEAYRVVGVAKDITERKQAELALQQLTQELENRVKQRTQDLENSQANLRQREQEVRTLVENSPNIVARYDWQLRHLYVNPASTQACGLSPEECIGKTMSELGMPPDFIVRREAAMLQVFQTGEEVQLEILFPTPKGWRWFQSRFVPERNPSGEVATVLEISRDITHQKQTELELRESEQKFRQLAETIDEVFFLCSRDGQQLLYINPAYEKIWGRTCQSLYKQPTSWLKAIHPEDRERILATFVRETQNQANFHDDFQIVRPDGTVRWISVHSFFVLNEIGQAYRIAGIAQDITDRKLAEQELADSQRFIQRIADASPHILYIYDLVEKRIIYVNRGIASILGYTPAEVQAMGSNLLPNLMHPDDFANVPENLERIHTAAEGEIMEFEYRMRHANGEWRWIYSHETIFTRTAEGAVKQILGTSADISDRKVAEAKLRESAERFRAIFEQAAVGMSRVSLSGQFLQVNQRFCDLTGYSEAELVGRTFQEITYPDDLEADLELVRQLTGGEIPSFSLEKRYLRKDGQLQWVNLTVSPVRDSQGAIKYNIGVIEDISDRKLAEGQIRASLAEKEALLKEIYHRVKNNLNVINSLLNMQARTTQDEVTKNLLLDSQRRLQTMALIHEQLYQSETLAKIDFAEYIHRLVSNLFASSNLNSNLIRVEIQADPVTLNLETAIPSGLLINELVTNAFKHAFPGGRSGTIRVEFHQTPDQHLNLIISDNGVGLPPDVNLQKTSSLGMRLVQVLVQQLRATLHIVRQDGTRFHLTYVQIQ